MSCKFSTAVFCLATAISVSTCGPIHSQVTVTEREPADPVAVDRTVVLVRGQPFFAKIIQHNGEPFSYLSSLGFNTVQLPGTATEQQLQEAANLGIWLICSPPASIHRQAVSTRYSPVLAWSVSEKGTQRELPVVRQTVDDLQTADTRLRRPVFAHAATNWSSFGQAADILGLGEKPLGTTFSLLDYDSWLADRTNGLSMPVWVDIQTEHSPALQHQVAAMSEGQGLPLVEAEQLKFLAYEAASAGARGFRFLSQSPLDGSDSVSQLRALTLNGLLRHLDQLAPFLAGGLAQRLDSGGEPNVHVHSIKLPSAAIYLVQRTTGLEQWCCGDVQPQTVTFLDASSSVTDRGYVVNELGATPLPDRRSGVGSTLQIPACPFTGCVLVTQDPRVLQHFALLPTDAAAAVQLRRELTRQWLSVTHLTELALAESGRGFPFVGSNRLQAETHFRNAEQMLNSGNLAAALGFLEQANSSMAEARRLLHQTFIADALVSAPLLSHFTAVPQHLRFTSNLAGAEWQPNTLPAGDFEHLPQLSQSGWTNRRDDADGLGSKVELSKQGAVDGDYGISLEVRSTDSGIVVPQAPALWIQTPPVVVRSGQLIRIHGYANVQREITGHEGLLITDSVGGPDLAIRIPRTAGWQEFTIFRIAAKSGPVNVTFTMHGMGQAFLDEITIQLLEIPERRPAGDTIPTSATQTDL
jgi:hypothetical protein